MLAEMDPDCSGTVTFSEFLAGMLRGETLKARAANTSLTLSEFVQVLAATGAHSQLFQIFAEMDADGDGTIDKSEFTVWAEEQGRKIAELESRLTAARVLLPLRYRLPAPAARGHGQSKSRPPLYSQSAPQAPELTAHRCPAASGRGTSWRGDIALCQQQAHARPRSMS